jgi:hypothetical protein
VTRERLLVLVIRTGPQRRWLRSWARFHTATVARGVSATRAAIRGHGQDTSGAAVPRHKSGTNRDTQHQPTLTDINRHLRRPPALLNAEALIRVLPAAIQPQRNQLRHALAGRADIAGIANHENCCSRTGRRGGASHRETWRSNESVHPGQPRCIARWRRQRSAGRTSWPKSRNLGSDGLDRPEMVMNVTNKDLLPSSGGAVVGEKSG